MATVAVVDQTAPADWQKLTSTLQLMLNSKFGCSLKVDGDFGAKTRKALANLNAVDLCVLELQLTKDLNMGVKSLYVQERGFGMPDTVDISETKAQAIIVKLCKLLDMRGHEADFLGFVRLEAYPSDTVDGPGFNNLSRRPGSPYRGLGQFDQKSWNGARLHILQNVNIDIDIGEYKDNVYKPAHALAAVIGYAHYNKSKMVDWNVPVNAETLYMSHNQGVYWWQKRGLPIAGNQSEEAKAIAAKYRALLA